MANRKFISLAFLAFLAADCGPSAARSASDAPAQDAADEVETTGAADDDAAREAGEIAGFVTDEFGVPAARVEVTWTPNAVGAKRTALTAADGGFRVSGLPTDAVGALYVPAGEGRGVGLEPARAGAHGLHMVRNRPRTPITGRVVEDGKPVSRRIWLLFGPVNPRLAPFVQQAKRTAPVQSDGSFTIPAAQGAEYALSLAVGDHEVPLGEFPAGARDVELRLPATR